MPKELNTTTEEIMNKINKGQIKMRPRLYFVLGYFLTFMGLAFSFVTSIFFVALTRFMVRSHGPMGQYRLDQILSSFSFWIPLVAVFGLIVGIWILKKYDISYKVNFKILIIGIIASILIAGFIIDMTGLTDSLVKKGRCYGGSSVINVNDARVIDTY